MWSTTVAFKQSILIKRGNTKRNSTINFLFVYISRRIDLSVQWLEKRSKAFEPTYLYTMEKVKLFFRGSNEFSRLILTNISNERVI